MVKFSVYLNRLVFVMLLRLLFKCVWGGGGGGGGMGVYSKRKEFAPRGRTFCHLEGSRVQKGKQEITKIVSPVEKSAKSYRNQSMPILV